MYLTLHYCVKARGVMDASSMTHTVALGGLFEEDATSRRIYGDLSAFSIPLSLQLPLSS